MTATDKADVGIWRQFVRKLIGQLNAEERELLMRWAQQLLDVRSANTSTREKIKQAARVATQCKPILPVVKLIGREVKRLGWDDRGLPARVSLSAVLVSVTLFGWAGSGIAAFGGAIAVPLWIVFGAGAGFAAIIIDEVRRTKIPPKTPPGKHDAV
ncbi:hypothetical protein [Dongia sp.]|uniref:hypothetical protein n=1 Tax=Dongia sp. TaxID=1977262 RepID=UPI0034A5BA01